jgi:hypothetical protein
VDLERLLDKPVLRNLRTFVGTVRAITFVGTILVSASALIYLVARNFKVEPGLAIGLIVLLALMLAVSVYAWRYVTHVYDPPFYEIFDLNGHLTVERANSHRRYVYERRQTVIATRDDLRLIEFRAHWTGQGAAGSTQVESIRPEHVVFDGRRGESDGRVHRWVYPRRQLKRGQPIEVGIRQVHEDDVQEQLPYFREGGGRYKTRKVTVCVVLPQDEHIPDSVRGVAWNTNHTAQQGEEVGEISVHSRVDAVSRSVEYTVTYDKPKVFHSYGIEWVWAHQAGS